MLRQSSGDCSGAESRERLLGKELRVERGALEGEEARVSCEDEGPAGVGIVV